MQISSKDLIYLIGLITFIFLIAPLFLIIYISLYNQKKAKHAEEKAALKKTFELELLKSQIEVQENILQMIASNLHDNIGQLLSLTSMTLSSIQTDSKREEKIRTAGELTLRAIQELRQLSKRMNGQELIKKNLAHAITYELDWLRRGTEYKINFTDNTTYSIPENADIELILFRLLQETISNIIKHAEATAIDITLNQAPGLLTLSVKDNGKGFVLADKLKTSEGMGLSNLSKRAAMMDGTFNVTSSKEAGTEILVSIPYI